MPNRKPIHYDLEWTHPLTGARNKLRNAETADYLGEGNTHLEIRSLVPRNARGAGG
jgi:hypothetical protein